jgi:hypothetical protein
MSDEAIVRAPKAALARPTTPAELLERVRPEWQSRSLIQRVRTILPHDPSSACQRLFNAAIHDLRNKVVIAGIDIAKEAAKTFKLPPIEKPEDVEEYSTARLIDLAYRMGLLSEPDWRRLVIAYEIRRNLEHEDDSYEAEPQDCYFVFTAAINAVLSQDPIQPVRVSDIKDLVEGTTPTVPSAELLSEYEHAPQPRQIEICSYLVSTALSKQPDLVRQKAVEMLRYFQPITKNGAKIEISKLIQEKVGRSGIELAHAKVAHAIGALPYLKRVQLHDFYAAYLQQMDAVGYNWKQHAQHEKLLGDLESVGGLTYCPDPVLRKMAKWLILAYIGEPGGYGMGINRPVFYSDTAAPTIARIVKNASPAARKVIADIAANSKTVKRNLSTKAVERRLEDLLDMIEEK